MRPSIGCMIKSSSNIAVNTDLAREFISSINLSKRTSNDEGKMFLNKDGDDSIKYVMIPLHIKGNDRSKWVRGFAIENGLMDFAQNVVIIDR